MLLSILLTIYSSMFWKSENYVMDNYDTITHNIPCEEVNSICFQKGKFEFVKFDFLDGVNYCETHYYTNNIQKRYEGLKKYYKKNKTSYESFDVYLSYILFEDVEYSYELNITKAPSFIGVDSKVVSVSKSIKFFR